MRFFNFEVGVLSLPFLLVEKKRQPQVEFSSSWSVIRSVRSFKNEGWAMKLNVVLKVKHNVKCMISLFNRVNSRL